MPPVQEDPESGSLSNTLYTKRTHSSRRLTRGRLFLYRMIVPVGLALIRLVWRWGRVTHIEGIEHAEKILAAHGAFIPVYWHQHQLFCVRLLLQQRHLGLKLGFLISPSVDGEIGALLVRKVGGYVIRGSSTHTGARALRDYYQALAKEAISPAITPDGPRGPAWKVKPGAVLLGQMSGKPILPMAYAASRAWMIKWDRFVIPYPLARIAIVIGEPVYIPKGLDAAKLENHQAELELRLKKVFSRARSLLE
jgi:lysophospholipid acyltransferase (LPLAT)-like uncharacterized protein